MARYSSLLVTCIEIVYNFCDINLCASNKLRRDSGTFKIVDQQLGQGGSIRVYQLKFPRLCVFLD